MSLALQSPIDSQILLRVVCLIGAEDRQMLLATLDAGERLHRIAELLAKEIYVLELAHKIEGDVKAKIDQSQREYYLREQVRAIEKELGEEGEEAGEVGEYRNKLESFMPLNTSGTKSMKNWCDWRKHLL